MPRLLGLAALITTLAAALGGPPAMAQHVLSVTEPITVPEDGLLLGNGDLSVSVYQTRDRIIFRFGKGDVWDRRVDYSDDPQPPTIAEIAHGIAVERWKCDPYGGGTPVALNGTEDPQRLKELCDGCPPSYRKRPYPCPKPVGEMAFQLPPDLPELTVRQDLTIEEGILRITASSPVGVELRLTAFIPPEPNVLVVRWGITGWDKTSAFGHDLPPVWAWLYRWADPTIKQFGQRFAAEYIHGGFVDAVDADRCSPLPAPTLQERDGRRSIEQTFQPEPTFPGGFRYLLTPYLSAGSVYPQNTADLAEARLRLWPPNDALSGWAVVAVPSESDPGGAAAEDARIAGLLTGQPEARLDQWETATKQSAADFWAHSAVTIADPLLEDLWYEVYHAKRCVMQVGKTPAGLFMPSTVPDYTHWHGDYHTNYNFQQPFYGDYTANHLEVGDAYFTGMAYLVQMGRIIAQRYYNSPEGIFIQLTGYPITATDDVLGAVPMGRMAYMTGWCANEYWWRYQYTLDRQWLRDEGYPVLRGCAHLYLDFLTKGEDGLYHAFPSNQGEDGFSGNAKDYTDRPQVMRHVRNCLRMAIQASEVLDTDADLRARLRDRLEHLAGDDGNTPPNPQGLARYFYEASSPEFGDGSVPRPWDLTEGPAWPGPGDGFDTWYSGQYPISAVANLRCGGLSGSRAYTGLRRLIQRWRHPNGLVWAMSIANYGHAGAWAETLGITGPLSEMLLQSYGSVIRLFPAWPKDVAASFRTLRAEGAFLVSASWVDGKVTACQIASEKGALCRIYYPGGFQVHDATGGAVPVALWQGDIYEFQTEPGQTYRLTLP
jgi:hypothetical protein